MTEKTTVRQNMIDDKNYRPYCGQCRIMPRIDKDFKCPTCGKVAVYDPEFMARYNKKWADK